jgi:hypothetical protein
MTQWSIGTCGVRVKADNHVFQLDFSSARPRKLVNIVVSGGLSGDGVDHAVIKRSDEAATYV